MATVTKKMSPEEIQALYKRLKPHAKKESRPQYTYWQIKTSDLTITAYTSGKVVYQGKDVSWLADSPDTPAPEKKKSASPSVHDQGSLFEAHTVKAAGYVFPQAGSDEVGNGDYLGPFVVASTIVPDQQTAAKLKELQVTDSKAMTDERIRQVAPRLKTLLPYSIQILDNTHYNQIYDHDTMNLNRIKSRMHNQAYLNLETKGFKLPDLKVIDQFCLPKAYYSHLKGVPKIVDDIHFETKAESRYPAVAAASVLARYAFLQVMDQLEQKYGMPIAKGGGPQATLCARKLKEKYGMDELKHVAKLHFTNTQKL